MMKRMYPANPVLILCVLLVQCSYIALAQSPHYKCSTWPSIPNGYARVIFNSDAEKFQSLYYPRDFVGMPKGSVTNLYLRTENFAGDASDVMTYHNVAVKLGYTGDSTYKNVGGYDSFKRNLTTVFFASAQTFIGRATNGAWYKFQLSGNWNYDPARNFVLEVSHSGEGGQQMHGFNLMASTLDMKARSVGSKWLDSARTYNNYTGYYLDLGFDIVPTEVNAFSRLRSFGLFPNPSTDGRFVISAECLAGAAKATIRVINTVGQEVYHAEYKQPGASFFKEVNLSGMPAGVYIAELSIGGERITRKLTLQ